MAYLQESQEKQTIGAQMSSLLFINGDGGFKAASCKDLNGPVS